MKWVQSCVHLPGDDAYGPPVEFATVSQRVGSGPKP